ncbi:MAG: hypothetical protein EAX95_10390 [Candidatus Thorarchaeota archaeon]|nr:hypothetical protein [Candidatus Thorarchaeota archaeon]
MVITCRKCREPFYVQSAEIRGNTLRVFAQCLKGHKGRREFARVQADAVALELFEGIFICVECGKVMSLAHTDVQRDTAEFVFVCPVHGPVRKEIPSYYMSAITHLKGQVNSAKSILDSLSCPKCSEVFIIHEIEDKQGILYLKSKCPNGHKEIRFLAREADDSILKALLKRLVHCDDCGLPCSIEHTETKRDRARIEMSCPVHGRSRKEIPAQYAPLLDDVIEAVSDAGLVRSMLRCRDCGNHLSIRNVEGTKDGLKFKVSCASGHSYDLTQQVQWSEESTIEIAKALLKCNECDLITEVVSKKIDGTRVELELLCPIHGEAKKGLTLEVYKQFEAASPEIARQPTLDESLKCRKCGTPIILREIKPKKSIIEAKIECQNGHGDNRYFPLEYSPQSLSQMYSKAFECTKCHEPMKLLEIVAGDNLATAKIQCGKHGENKLEIPLEHMSPLKDAYVATVSASQLESIIPELGPQDSYKYQVDPSQDALELLQIVKSVIEQHDLRLTSELSPSENEFRVWYYGRAMMGDEYVLLGSVSMADREILLEGYSNNKERITSIMTQMNDELRDILLRMHAESEDLSPKIIKCARCQAALEKRGLPGETTICNHCGTPLHWG